MQSRGERKTLLLVPLEPYPKTSHLGLRNRFVKRIGRVQTVAGDVRRNCSTVCMTSPENRGSAISTSMQRWFRPILGGSGWGFRSGPHKTLENAQKLRSHPSFDLC